MPRKTIRPDNYPGGLEAAVISRSCPAYERFGLERDALQKQSDPYRKAQKRLEKLRTDLRKGGKLLPSQECVMLIKRFYEAWDSEALGSLDDAIAVFARRNNVSFSPASMERALAAALIGEDSPRVKRAASEWAKVLKATRKMAIDQAESTIQKAGGIDALAKNGMKPRDLYLLHRENKTSKAKQTGS